MRGVLSVEPGKYFRKDQGIYTVYWGPLKSQEGHINITKSFICEQIILIKNLPSFLHVGISKINLEGQGNICKHFYLISLDL